MKKLVSNNMHQVLRAAYGGIELDAANGLLLYLHKDYLCVNPHNCVITLDNLVGFGENYFLIQNGILLQLDEVDIEQEIILIVKAPVMHNKKEIHLVYRYL